MKSLSDYKDEEALELWADLLEPISVILTDKEMQTVLKSKKVPIIIAKEILKRHHKEASEILLRIDNTQLNGLNIVTRLVQLITDIGKDEDVKSFFGFVVQEAKENVSSGSVTENTEESVH